MGAYSVNTIKSHTNQMSQFVSYCHLMGLELGDHNAVVAWVLHARDTLHRRKNTLLAKLQAYKWCHATVWQLGEVESGRGSVLGLLERSIARLADDKMSKLAVSRYQLDKLIQALEKAVPEVTFKEYRAWWCISYAAFLRCSEAAGIRWDDVKFERTGDGYLSAVTISLTVRDREIFRTSTESIRIRLLRADRDKRATCPVLSLWSWRKALEASSSHMKGHVFTEEIDVVRKCFQNTAATTLGGTNDQYGLHSLRAGSATDAKSEGKCLSEIMFSGRWKSATVLQYLRGGEQRAQQLGLNVRGLRDVRVISG